MGDNRIARLERRVGELEKRVTELEDEDGETALDVKLAMGEVKELLVDRVRTLESAVRGMAEEIVRLKVDAPPVAVQADPPAEDKPKRAASSAGTWLPSPQPYRSCARCGNHTFSVVQTMTGPEYMCSNCKAPSVESLPITYSR